VALARAAFNELLELTPARQTSLPESFSKIELRAVAGF
jgi:hypothetical protein